MVAVSKLVIEDENDLCNTSSDTINLENPKEPTFEAPLVESSICLDGFKYVKHSNVR